MVSVRRSHQTSSLNFEQWLKTLELIDVKKAIKIRNYRDKNRKNSPLIQCKDAVIVRTDKLKNIPMMIKKMSLIIEKKVKHKYGS